MRTSVFLTLLLLNTAVFAKSSFCTTETFGDFEKIKLETGSYKLINDSIEDSYTTELHIENYQDSNGKEFYKIDTRFSAQQEGLDYWLVGIDGRKKTIPETDAGHTKLRIDCEDGNLEISYYIDFWSRFFEIRKQLVYDPITNEPIANGLVLLRFDDWERPLDPTTYLEFAPVK